jgi:hypothetical protein
MRTNQNKNKKKKTKKKDLGTIAALAHFSASSQLDCVHLLAAA